MTMANTAPPARRSRLLNLRVAGMVMAVLAILFYVNLPQVDDENQAALYSSSILVSNIDRVVAEHREAETNALYEYCLLVAAGLGVIAVVAGPAVIRRLTRP